MRQLELDLWWHDSNIWRERHLISVVSRPCEDEALNNIYADSRIAHSVNVAPKLSGIERRVYTLELRSMRELPKWYTPADRHKWIVKQSHLAISEIKSILDNVSYVLRDLEVYERVMVAIDATSLPSGKEWRNSVKDAMSG